MGETIRAAGYVRVSSRAQAEHGHTLDAHPERVRDLIKSEGWQLTRIYQDVESGHIDDRPELEKLLSTLSEIDRVVIVNVDRLGRDELRLFQLYKLFAENGVELRSIEDNIDGSENGLLLRGLKTTLAAHEGRQSGRRVKQGIATSASKGNHHSQWPYGYTDGKPVQPAASIVLRIFQASADGQSQRSTAIALNDEGILTPKGHIWGQSQIKAVLDNVTYTGRIKAKDGTIYEGNHEAIVSVELWDRVQAMRKANRRDKGGQARGRRAKSKHLFTKGLLRCAHCGSAMVPFTLTSGHESYICNRRKQSGKDACIQKTVPRALLDAAVFEFFESERFDPDATKRQIEQKATATHAQWVELLDAAKRAEAKAAESLKRVRSDYTAGDISAAEWREEFRPELESALKATLGKRAQLEGQVAVSAAEAKAVTELADSSAIRGLANVRAEIAGQVAGSSGIDSVRASLGMLFERFEIARVTADTEPLTSSERAIAAAQAGEHDETLLDLGQWTVAMYPREEWIGDLNGYWTEILGRVPLTIKEQSISVANSNISTGEESAARTSELFPPLTISRTKRSY
jgi:site-specific DNA recombinase